MLQETVQQILEHHSRPIWRSREPTQSRIATRWGLQPLLLAACGVALVAWIFVFQRRNGIAAAFAMP